MRRGDIYPSWRYHADGRSIVCLNGAHDEALGSNWSDVDIRDFSPKEPFQSENSVETGDLSEKADLVPTSDGVGPKKRGRPKKA